jgi:hypothetical protein
MPEFIILTVSIFFALLSDPFFHTLLWFIWRFFPQPTGQKFPKNSVQKRRGTNIASRGLFFGTALDEKRPSTRN